MQQAHFRRCVLLTDQTGVPTAAGIEKVAIAPLRSSAAYSDFILTRLVDHVHTSHCLLVQWDGHVISAQQWCPEFLDYDYIGASWPQFADGHDVGNGGFSLRSRRLMELCRADAFRRSHPEDMAIGRDNRHWLEDQGMTFAPKAMADRFSTERAGDPAMSFGYHGTWHMPQVLGGEAFWDIYRTLDDRTTINHDLAALMRQVWRGPGGASRAVRLLGKYVRDRCA